MQALKSKSNPYFASPTVCRGPRSSLHRNLAGAGGGKGGGGSARAAREEPDSVRSKAFARIKDVVSEGPILGPIDEDGNALDADQLGRAILLDETPLQNSDGSFNFKNVTVHFVAGTANQGYIPGFDSEESLVPVGVRAQNAGDSVTRSISNTSVDAVRVTVRIPALVRQDSTSGDITGYSVQFAIDVNNNGGGWVEKVNRTVNDKISSPYLMDFRIDLDSPGPWQVRVRRISPKAETAAIQNETWFDSFTEIIDGKFRHPFTSMFGLEIDAEQLSAIPNVAYRIGGRIIRVPTNYDPVARTYSGTWDGTFKLEWTDNPAWIYYDILTSKRYGLGRWIADDIVDKWALYAIGVVCDTMVDDGFGGTEPLYTCNLCLEQEVDAYKALYDLASVFHGLALWAGGSFTAVQDTPRDAVAQFTNANVEGGKFEYTGASKDARHSHVNVWWNNPANLYKREPVFVPDEEQLLKYWNPTELTAFGCTRESQAIRRGRHLLLSEKLASQAVTFVCGLDGAHVRPNMVFKVLDQYRAGKPFGGRVKTGGTTTVVLDRQVTLEQGKAYILNCVKPDGSLMRTPIQNTMTTTDTLIMNISLPFPVAPLAQSVWLLESTSLVPTEYECVGIKPEDGHPGKYRIVGVEYNASKFAAITDGLELITNPTSELQNPRLVKPPGEVLTITEEAISTPISLRVFLNVSWDASEDAYLRGYRLSWRYNQGNWQLAPESIAPNCRIETVGPGIYEFRVVAVNNLGRESGASAGSYMLGNSSPIENAVVTGIEIFGKGNDPTFEGRDCKLVWRINSAFWHELGLEPGGGDDGFMHPLFRDYVVNIYDATTSTLLRTESVQDPSYVYTYEKNAEDARTYPQAGGSTAARRAFRVTVQIRDRYNNVSTPTSLRVSNPAPAAPSISITPDLGGALVRVTLPTDLDWSGFVVHASTSSGFTPADGNKVYDGPDTQIRIPLTIGSTWYLRIAAYDAFGKTGLNYANESTVVPAAKLDTVAPNVPANVALTSSLIQDANGEQRIELVGTWDANTEPDFDKYIWRIKEVAGGPFTWLYGTAAGVNSNRITFTAKANTAYELQVAATDSDANPSAFSASATHTTTKDTVAPGVPTNVQVLSGIRINVVTWENVSDADLSDVLIWRNTTNSFPGGNPYAVVSARAATAGNPVIAGNYVDTQVTQGQGYYYFLKSRDTSGNVTGSYATSAQVTPGLTQPADLADWAVGLTKRFHATIALNADIWTDNSPAAGRIAWNSHELFFGGAKYTISAGNTPAGHKYVYWDSSNPTVYATSTSNPTLTDTQFMIATNLNGAHDLAWNALANIVVKNAFIESISADKITAGVIEAQIVTIGSAGNTTNSAIQSYNFSAGSAGWRILGDGSAEFSSVTIRGSSTVGGVSSANVAQGATRANNAINSSNNLVTAFAPGSSAPASGSGLFLGNDFMGYYASSAWQTYMDSSGRFYLGGSSGKLQWNGSALTIEGTITVASTIAGVSGTNVASGVNRANTGLDNAGKLITAVLPGATVGASPSSAGLYLGSDYMGYYNGGWKTYMDNAGNFYLGGTSGKLTWNGSALAIDGTVTSTSGTIGGFTLGASTLTATNLSMSTAPHFRIGSSSFERVIMEIASGRARLSGYNSSGTLTSVVQADDGVGQGLIYLGNASGTHLTLSGSGAIISDGDLSFTTSRKIKINTNATSVVYSDENWGWQAHGDATHPFTVPDASILVGFSGAGGNYSTGRIYLGSASVYLYVSGGALWLNDGNGNRALT